MIWTRKRGLPAALSAAALTIALTGVAPAQAQEPGVHLEVDIAANIITGFGFTTPVTVTVDGQDPGGQLESYGDAFTLYLYPEWGDGIDLVPGQVVEASDASTTKDVTLADLEVTSWDFGADTLSGTTDQEANVLASAWHGGAAGWTQVTPDAGAWTVDFTTSEPAYDLRVADRYELQQFDADGDATTVTGAAVGPQIAVGLEVQEVMGIGWPAGSTVTLTIDREPGGGPDWTGSAVPSNDTMSNWLLTAGGRGGAYFDLTTGDFQVEPGDVMTMTDGTTTKTLVVDDVMTGLPNKPAESVSGTASVPAGSFLTVAGDGWWTGSPQREPAVVDGIWTAWFADDETYDMSAEGVLPYAWITDADGDMTESLSLRPTVWADPSTDRVWAVDLGTVDGTEDVTLTVTRTGTPDFTTTVTPTNVLTRGSWNLDMWATPTGELARPAVALFDLGTVDLRGGSIVSVTDGTSTQTFPVAELTVDSVSAATDTITGTATEPLGLHLGDGEGGYWGYDVTPVAGHWSYTFTPGEFPNPPEGLTTGMTGQAIVRPGTLVRWTVGVPQPSDLVPLVQALGLTPKVAQRLLAPLADAQKAYDAGSFKIGNRAMNTFIKSVRSMSPRLVPSSDASRLVTAAQTVIAAHTT